MTTTTAATSRLSYLHEPKGIVSWLTTLDHKRIGVLYLISISASFLIGGIMALLVRTELLNPGHTIVDPDTYNQFFSLHGAIMVFLFVIPGIPAALGNFVLPLMLGAKDVAFPRLNLTSWYLWVIGSFLAIFAITRGGIDTGWTFYTPYSTDTSTQVTNMVLAVFILGFSSILTGLNFIVTIHKLRPHGMTWFRMPLFLWALYATAIMQVLATPVLGITLLLLVAERTLGVGIFDPNLGGDPLLYQHFFWFYSHPAVYIMILPAMGVMSELISTHARKTIFGYQAVALSSVAIALFSFLVWGHHMFTAMSPMANTIFSALTFSVSIPSAVKVFNWIATLHKGSIRLTTPMIYALSFIFLFGIGGLTGLFLGTLAIDVHLHDTYFIVAHFHYVMFGGTVIAFLGGLFHWWPKMFGRMYNETPARIGALMIFLGFNMTFFTQFIMGSQGMPRRYYDYPAEFTAYHQFSSIGSYLMALGFFLTAGVLIQSLVAGKRAVENPWGSATLEWRTATPPIVENFEETPDANEPYDYSVNRYNPQTGNFDYVGPQSGSGHHGRRAGLASAESHS